MNENEINVLLDQFVDGLDTSESASVIRKINTRPLWSDTYKRINKIFGALKAIHEQTLQQPPVGLASRTFQRIMEQNSQNAPAFIANSEPAYSSAAAQSPRRKSAKVKPSFLALCVCAGFLLVTTPAAWLYMGTGAVSGLNSAFISQNNGISPVSKPNNFAPHYFAQTGIPVQQNSPLTFCSHKNAISTQIVPCNYNANSELFAVNSANSADSISEGVQEPVPARYLPCSNYVQMSCPDGCVVLVPQAGCAQPLVVIPSKQMPNELQRVQNVVNPSYTPAAHASFVMPVNYQK